MRVFAGLQHAAQPVERGVGVGVADGFVQRGDEVVVLLALLVVEQDALLEGLGGDVSGDACRRGARGEFGGDFEGVEGVAGVAAGVGGDGLEGAFVGGEVLRCAQAALGVGEGALQEGEDLRCR